MERVKWIRTDRGIPLPVPASTSGAASLRTPKGVIERSYRLAEKLFFADRTSLTAALEALMTSKEVFERLARSRPTLSAAATLSEKKERSRRARTAHAANVLASRCPETSTTLARRARGVRVQRDERVQRGGRRGAARRAR